MLVVTKKRKGESSGILLVNMYAMEFFKLSEISQPGKIIIFSELLM